MVEQHLKKGSKVLVEGKIKTRSWEDQSGVTRYTTEIHVKPFNGQIVFLGGKRDSDEPADGAFGRGEEQPTRGQRTGAGKRAGGSGSGRRGGRKTPETVGGFGGGSDLDDSEIPF